MFEATNLLTETLEVLQKNERTPDEVFWVGSKNGNFAIYWAEFEKIAQETNYDSGYGSTEINDELVVVGVDWWLERHEYDGSEWWEYKSLPTKKESKTFNTVLKTDYSTNWTL